jgi:phenylalanyl-tRNA synthetase alpha chain
MTDEKEQSLSELLAEALTAVTGAADTSALEQLRVFYLGKKGVLTGQLKRLGSLPAEQRPAFGKDVQGCPAVFSSGATTGQ